VLETLEVLRAEAGFVSELDERLRGLNLGDLAGLSRSEAQHLYPEAAERLDLWREGQLLVDALQLPGGEPIESFRSRIEAALTAAIGRDGDSIVLAGTRSSLIMMNNLLRLDEEFSYERYVSIDIPEAAAYFWCIGPQRPAPSPPS
jgi:broad specificity phosphatase PhoE